MMKLTIEDTTVLQSPSVRRAIFGRRSGKSTAKRTANSLRDAILDVVRVNYCLDRRTDRELVQAIIKLRDIAQELYPESVAPVQGGSYDCMAERYFLV